MKEQITEIAKRTIIKRKLASIHSSTPDTKISGQTSL